MFSNLDIFVLSELPEGGQQEADEDLAPVALL
jgi:hypothetical protein